MVEEQANSGASPPAGRSGGGGTGGGSGGGNRNRSRNRNRNRNRSGGGGGNRGGSNGTAGAGGDRRPAPGRSGASRSGSKGGGGQPARAGGASSNRRRGSAPGGGRNGASRTLAPTPVPLAPLTIEPGLGATEVLPGEVRANHRHAVTLCALAALLPALVLAVVLGLVFSLVVGAIVLVVVEVAVAWGLWRAAPRLALRQVGAVPLAERDNPRLFNVTDGLCATFGLRMPSLHVVYDAVPNACALGRDAGSGDVVVTSGLLEMMGPIELEGVIAHELAHVKRADNGVSVIALTLARFGGAGLLRRCVPEGREYRADVVGASAVRYPRGLLDALRLMEGAPAPAGNSVFSATRFPATRFVWIDPSVGHRDGPAVPGDLDVTSVRAAALSEW